MLKAGATVIISGRSQPALENSINALKATGHVTGWPCDVRDAKQVYALARQTVEQFGHSDVWVNNTGFSGG